MLRCNHGRIDGEGLDRVNDLKNFLDLGPVGDVQENIGAGLNVRHSDVGLARCDGAENVDLRQDRAVIVSRPVHDRKDAIGRKAHDAACVIEDLLSCDMAEADPGLYVFLDPQEFDLGDSAHRQTLLHDQR